VLGSVLGPDPYPRMVRDFHRVIGEEAREQFAQQAGGLPDVLVACVGGGSNAIGLFHAFLDDRNVRKVGVEAGGAGLSTGRHAARIPEHSVGVLHGTRTLVLQDEEGQIAATHSLSAGLDYPAVGPEHVLLEQTGRVEYTFATDAEAVAAFHLLAQTEGILPALESADAVAEAVRHAPELSRKRIILVNLSGRGDKDVESVLEYDREHPGAGLPRRERVEPIAAAGHGWRGVTPVILEADSFSFPAVARREPTQEIPHAAPAPTAPLAEGAR